MPNATTMQNPFPEPLASSPDASWIGVDPSLASSNPNVPMTSPITPFEARQTRILALRTELAALLEEQAKEDGANMAEVEEGVRSLLRAGKEMDAIKFHRGKTGCSLIESRDAMHRYKD